MQGNYAEILIPLRFRKLVTYSIPEELKDKVIPGSIVEVRLARVTCNAVVRNITDNPDYDPKKIKPINGIVNLPPIYPVNIEFMEKIADYYMCATNDVLRISPASTTKALKRTKKEETESNEDAAAPAEFKLPVLTPEQASALEQINRNIADRKTSVLKGVSASGKTEIYINIAAEALKNGRNVLYLVPETAICRQIQFRLKKVFGERLIIYHSGRSAALRREAFEKIAANKEPHIILGLRSALFLPFENLGAIIVDEEHDYSYKQTEPAPRYNGRDAALILGQLMHCPVILGSATPSFETIYNVRTGKFAEVCLDKKYFGEGECRVRIVDMIDERRHNCVKGSFSFLLINAIKERLEKGEQCLIFRSRRAYATLTECPECGYIPRCPKCNIPLSYHKYNNTLSCHICDYREYAQFTCPSCGKGEMRLLGEGTEKIEEELEELFPEARIERFDADVTRSNKESEEILKRFANGECDILVGTQMLAKGFDFEKLTLTAVIKAETLASVMDFRADEKALQLLRQLKGRAGRRGNDSEMIIQTTRKAHPVFKMLLSDENDVGEELLEERRDFDYPPYIRLIRITLKSANKTELRFLANFVKTKITDAGIDDVTGPTAPPVDRSDGKFVKQFIIRLPRSSKTGEIKKRLYESLSNLSGQNCIIDVDPINV